MRPATLQGDQVEDFTQIDRKRLEFTFKTNIIAMCVAGSPPEPSPWKLISPSCLKCLCCHLFHVVDMPWLPVLCTLNAVVAVDQLYLLQSLGVLMALASKEPGLRVLGNPSVLCA